MTDMSHLDSSPGDGQEWLGFQAGTADERAVDAISTEERLGVIRLHAPAVLDDQRLGRSLSEPSFEAFSDEVVSRLGLLGRGLMPECAERHRASLENFADQAQIREWRTDGDRDLILNTHAFDDPPGQAIGFGGRGVHLPVSDDEFLRHVDFLSGVNS